MREIRMKSNPSIPTNHKGEQDENLQNLLRKTAGGWIFVPEGEYDSIRINRPDTSLVGCGKETIIKGKENPAIELLLASRARISNLKVITEDSQTGILFGREQSTSTFLDRLVIDSDSDGIHKPSEATAGRGVIVNCKIKAEGAGIIAESGSGPLNYVFGNEGNAVREFIRWGVNFSYLDQNKPSHSDVWLTKESHGNLCVNNSNIEDRGSNNTIL